MTKNINFYTLVVLTIVLNLLFQNVLINDNLYIVSFQYSMELEQIEAFLDLRERSMLFIYIFIVLVLILKISLIAATLDIGCFFFGKEIKYKKLINIVVKAEFVFLLVIVFKTAWFYFIRTNYNLEDLQYFFPLSALNILGYEGLQPWFIYPFQVLNLFELAYWFLLAYFIGKELNENTNKGFSIVASSYGVSLLIWIVSIMFLTVNMS